MIETFDLYTPEHRVIYNEMLRGISYKRPYDTLEFFLNFSKGFEDLICLCYQESDKVFLLPGYLKPIHGFDGIMDFSSPYGYSGPIISRNADDQFIEKSWVEVERYFKSRNTISCFLRIGLDHQMIGFPGEMYPTLKNIKGKIVSAESQWLEFEHKVRKNVNKAIREGLKCKIVSGTELSEAELIDFYSVYKDTMVRNNAQNHFFYTIDTFKNFVSQCGELCLFSLIYDQNLAVSVEMVLISDDSIFSFLGGTLSEFFEKRPNDFLKYELINWSRINGIKNFVLGGGYGSEDGIFKYKKAFFPNDVVDYYTGRWVICHQSYTDILKELKTKYEAENNVSEEFMEKDFFPAYRKYMN
jgi:Acetyltransferase (GNAT) domain